MTPAQLPIAAKSLILIPTVAAFVRVRGVQEAAKVLAEWSDCPPVQRRDDNAVDIAHVVERVAGQRIFRARCLVRSLTLWFLLRRQGTDADLVIGAAPAPENTLRAHAWVEVNGTPINDASDVRDHYGSFDVEFPRLAPTPLSAR